jgi:pimeloyl-ACP methyl ester carboxylesterase
MMTRFAICAFTLSVLGCSYGISVRHAAGPDLLDSWRASIIEADDLSPRTRQTLYRLDLDQEYQRRPADVYARLKSLVGQESQPDLLFALAEISYLLGRKAEKWESGDACAYYYLCAGYAYHYLFDDGSKTLNTFDPRFRLACDLYNLGLSKCIRAGQKSGRLDPRLQLHLLTSDGKEYRLSVVHHGFPWKPAEFGPLLFSADYEVVGLSTHYQGYGLGVALIGTRLPTPESELAPGHAFYPREVSFPVTAFFRFEGSVADLGTQRAGKLELYNPLNTQTVSIKNWDIPLETDLSTPLAYFLSRSNLNGIEFTGLFNADKVQKRAGIYMFEPYQPGKIPVVMVHGLLSSPLTWSTMFNDLRADPTLRQHFQFWFYLYPTGDPYLETAADLRQSVARLRRELDPERADPALDHMVFVGHSMGGLVSKLLTVAGGDDFWALASSLPFNSLKVHPDTRAKLERLFFFNPEPCVRRVIFIGTPHHGSNLSPSLPARLISQFIELPKNLMATAKEAGKEDPHLLTSLHFNRIDNTIDLLAPQSPALELLASRREPERVHYHSIIGEAYGSGKDSTDGVVPYTSAHLDGVDSEITVPANHVNVHHHPRAVTEVWRILLEHLREVNGSPVSPPSTPPLAELPETLNKATRPINPAIVRR